jgi:thiamine pyrophosphokinase
MNGERTLLVLGGSPPSDELLSWRYEEADHAVAVDSGFLAFRHAGLDPEVLIGDMDSCGFDKTWEKENSSIRVIKLPDQDTTDFEKALDWVRKETETTELIILGGLGDRSDHLLSNLLTACNHDPSVTITFDDESEWIRRVTRETPLRLVGRNNAKVSLLPLTPCSKVSTTGLKWNLENVALAYDNGMSQSNLVTSDLVTISCYSGNLLTILQKQV